MLNKDSIGLISVIIPFYNQAEFIEETIQSLINQTYTNWEAIIVNDGSTEILPKFADSRVQVVCQNNGGLPSARNTGIRRATGEYIQFLDADDMLHPEKFEAQIAGLNGNNADIAISGYSAFKHPKLSDSTTSNTELQGVNPLTDFMTRWEKGLCIPIHCFLYRRFVIAEAGFFNQSLPNHEDWDFHIRCAARGYIYTHDPSKFALYRVHNKSMCRSTNMDLGRQMVLDIHKDWQSYNVHNRHDLTNVTFIYCVRIDSPERLGNLDFAMSFMWRNFYTNIILIEEDNESKIKGRYRDVNHVFIQSDNPTFHRTKLINNAVKGITTEYFCNIDLDVFFDASTYMEAVVTLEQYAVVYPYSGKFYDTPSYYSHNRMLTTADIDLKECGLVNPNSYGGAVFFRRAEFIQGGMENENFVSWGPEDNERYLRFRKLGYSIKRLANPLFHFTHPRGANSNETNPSYQRGVEEYEHISMLSKDELREYIKTFTWL